MRAGPAPENRRDLRQGVSGKLQCGQRVADAGCFGVAGNPGDLGFVRGQGSLEHRCECCVVERGEIRQAMRAGPVRQRVRCEIDWGGFLHEGSRMLEGWAPCDVGVGCQTRNGWS